MTVAVDDTDFRLYLGDCLDVLPTLDSGSADAIVTSPPYLDVRDDVACHGPSTFGPWADEWLAQLLRVCSPTGSMMLNLGRLHRDGEELDWWIDVLLRARQAGWRWLDTIVWHKVNGGGGRKTPYLIDRHEYVLWLSPTTEPYKGFEEARQPYSPATLERYTRKWRSGGGTVKGKKSSAQLGRTAHPDGAKAGTVFVCSAGAEKGIEHPTPMALDLADHLIKLSCPPGGLILDPFGGACTTAVAARTLGRRSVLIESEADHCEECARRLSQQVLV